MAQKIKLTRLHCKRCDYEWTPRSAKVYRCPKCMSFRWDEDDD